PECGWHADAHPWHDRRARRQVAHRQIARGAGCRHHACRRSSRSRHRQGGRGVDQARRFRRHAALPGTDGKLHAQEALIFPEAARGSGEGHYAWDLTPGSTMTNATVTEVESVSKDRILKLKHKDGANDIELSPEIPVVSFAPADASLLKPGATVFVPALKKADGSIVAGRVIAEND